MSQSQIATATGLATYAADVLLDVWYPQPALGDKAAHVTGLERGIDTLEVKTVGHNTSGLVNGVGELVKINF